MRTRRDPVLLPDDSVDAEDAPLLIVLSGEDERLQYELKVTTIRAEHAEAQRDMAWQELRAIRATVEADEQESTLDEVKRLMTRIERLPTDGGVAQ